VTLNVQVLDWPPAVAVQLTVVAPRTNTLPDGGVQVTGTELPAWSVAVAVKFTGEPHSPVTLAGQTMVGGHVPTVNTGGVAATPMF
jgi:hypothetical protein